MRAARCGGGGGAPLRQPALPASAGGLASEGGDLLQVPVASPWDPSRGLRSGFIFIWICNLIRAHAAGFRASHRNWILEEADRAFGPKPRGGGWGQVGTSVTAQAQAPRTQLAVPTSALASYEGAKSATPFLPHTKPPPSLSGAVPASVPAPHPPLAYLKLPGWMRLPGETPAARPPPGTCAIFPVLSLP